jgi:2',3'-cyclic-nucleotide 2'-phosphodiesterase (5'-nucleotidase family)
MFVSKKINKKAVTLIGGLSLLSVVSSAMAADITLIQISDLHGSILPHAGKVYGTDGSVRHVSQGGGVAKVATVVQDIRTDAPNSLTLAVGDSTHGTAEVMFTAGDAIMPAMNALGIDAFTPGNWEFGYGPAVFRNRFATFGPKPPLPANMVLHTNADGVPGIAEAEFPTLAINLYNDASSAPLPVKLHGKRVLDPYKMFEVDGVKVAVIGVTGTFLRHGNPAWNIGLRYTQGIEEMPGIIEEVKAAGAEFIVVLSEMGLGGNAQMAREFDDINVILSSHTHEVTVRPLLADRSGISALDSASGLTSEEAIRLQNGGTLVVEASEDTMIGRMDLTIRGGKIKNAVWDLVPVDNDVIPDPTVDALAQEAEAPFVGDGLVRHTFLPGGFCPGNDCGDTTERGLQLVEDLNTVVGYTDVEMHRHDVVERGLDNFISDSFVAATDSAIIGGVDLASTNGFRFGIPVLSTNEVPFDAEFVDGRATGEILLRDLFSIYPLPAGVVAAEVPGQSLVGSMETMLNNQFSRNTYLQRGGWYVGYSDSVYQHIDVINKPYASADGRVVKTWINGVPFDISKRYMKVGFYGHTYEIGQVSRTKGGVNPKFFELKDPDDYSSRIRAVDPVNSENIVVLNALKQVAPDAFLSPVHTMRRYLDSLPGNTVTEADFGTGRVVNVDTTKVFANGPYHPKFNPLSQYNPKVPMGERISPEAALPDYAPIPFINQPVEGFGPSWTDREVN